MEDQIYIRECDHCGNIEKQSTRFKTQEERAKFEAWLAGWITIGRHNGTPDGAQKHFCKHVCAIQHLQKDAEGLETEEKMALVAGGAQ